MKTFKELYDCLCEKRYSHINEFFKEKWIGKDKQESVFRLFAYMRLFSQFGDYEPCIGNYDKKTIRPLKMIRDIFSKSLKDKGDKSDLTLIKDNRLIVCSSKNLKEYHVGDLDIEKIYDIFHEKYQEYEIRLCFVVPCKDYFRNVISNMERNNAHLLKRCQEAIVLDHQDINHALYIFNNILSHDLIDEKLNKPRLSLYFHQQLAVDKFFAANAKYYTDILLGCIPRSGKSYIIAGIIHRSAADNFLLLTTCPKETIDQYTEIFSKYHEFDDFNVVALKSDKEPKLSEKNIIICSQQFLKTGKMNKIKNIPWLSNIDFDIVFSDETHNGGTTELSKEIMYKYRKNAVLLFVTATYNKPVEIFSIPKEAQILWDLEDIKLCKRNSKLDIIIKHGEEAKEMIDYFDLREYHKYPDFHLITLRIQDIIKEEIFEETKDTDYGWSTEGVLLLKSNDNIILEEFQDVNAVRNLCYLLFGDGKYVPSKKYKNNMMARIKDIINNPSHSSRWFSIDKPLIIMCFLPNGDDLDKLMKTFKRFLDDEKIIPDFEIEYINSKRGGDPVNIIKGAYELTKNNKKKGLLVLSGRQCSLGVSIHECDIVINLNNGHSFDQYIQMGFRSMTEAPNKRCGFLVDVNIQRAISIIVEEGICLYPKEPVKSCITKILLSRIITLNADELDSSFYTDSIKMDEYVEKILKVYNSSKYSNIDNVLSWLNFAKYIFDKEDQQTFNSLFRPSKKSKTSIKIQEDESVNKGVEKKNSKEKNKKDKKEKDIDFFKDVIRHIIPLVCILTIRNQHMNFLDMLNDISNDSIILEIFRNQVNIWWDLEHLDQPFVDTLSQLYNKYLVNNNNFNLTVRRVKELFVISLTNRKKLSTDIDKYLIPQEIEKKKNAEISTPCELRKDMLDSVTKYGNPDFWKTPKKILEPCCGKGGFLIDIVERFLDAGINYKTIVEECLYFTDINSTNIYICKLLLDPHNEFKLNAYCGNTLNMKTDKFDLVIGNPPYQARNSKGTGTPIWNKFVVYSLKNISKHGFLVFVHPAGWRKRTDKGHFKGLYELLTQDNYMKYLEIHDIADGKKTFKCGTRYDWYIVQKDSILDRTKILDSKGILEDINLRDTIFCPNYRIKEIFNLLSQEDHLIVQRTCTFHSTTTRGKLTSATQTKEYKYPVIHSIGKSEIKYKYSKINDKPSFGISKVIFQDSSLNDVIIDMEGIYGTTEHVLYIEVDDLTEATNIKNAMLTSKFKDIIDATLLSNFQIDYKIISLFKRDFWKYF